MTASLSIFATALIVVSPENSIPPLNVDKPVALTDPSKLPITSAFIDPLCTVRLLVTVKSEKLL